MLEEEEFTSQLYLWCQALCTQELDSNFERLRRFRNSNVKKYLRQMHRLPPPLRVSLAEGLVKRYFAFFMPQAGISFKDETQKNLVNEYLAPEGILDIDEMFDEVPLRGFTQHERRTAFEYILGNSRALGEFTGSTKYSNQILEFVIESPFKVVTNVDIGGESGIGYSHSVELASTKDFHVGNHLTFLSFLGISTQCSFDLADASQLHECIETVSEATSLFHKFCHDTFGKNRT